MSEAPDAPAVMGDRTTCGAQNRRGGPCKHPAGYMTDHLGFGECKFHTGSTPAGKARAAKDAALLALRTLAIPVTGSPVKLLQEAVDHARGVMVAAARLLEASEPGDVELRLRIYLEAVDRAAKVAKPAADARIDEALVALSERQATLLHELVEVFATAIGADEEARNRGYAAVAARIRSRSGDSTALAN